MATDSTNLPQGETTLDASIDMTGSDLDLTSVQVAQTEPANYVDLPKGNTVILLPVQPGQTVRLPTDSTAGLLAKIGPEGNLAIVVDGRTIILQGFLKANDQSEIKIVTSDGDAVNVAELIAATDPSLDIQTAAGPASGDQGDGTDGSGIYIPFLAGPGLGGILAEGILDPTALQYRLIDDEYILFTQDEDTKPDFDITFDILGGIVNEDDLPADISDLPRDIAAKFVFKEGGNDGKGNDEFDVNDREEGGLDSDGDDSNGNGADPDREPLSTVATVKVNFHGDVPGTLTLDLTKLPSDLTSEGEPIVYALDPAVPNPGGHGNGIFGYVENGGGAGYQEGIDRLVFEVHVAEFNSDSEFKVTFTLHDNIDNEAPDLNDDGKADLLTANEQLLGLPVHFTITDSDGSSVGGTLPFKVEDDKPFFGEVSGVGEGMQIIDTIAEVTHDETKGAQSDDGADDQSFFDFVPFPFPHFEPNIPLINLAADLYDQVVNQAGFSLPYGDSVGALLGAAQSQVKVSFGADGATQEHFKADGDPTARDSVFGAVSGTGENERPFELFMIDQESVNGTVPVEDNKSTVADEGNLTADPQKTNLTVTWNGEVLPVWLVQIDANTIVGYIEAESEGGEQSLQVVEGIGAGKEAVLVIDINDAGVLSFFQLHQLNHPDTTNGDEPIQILAEDNETPLIYVRASDYDGDHAIQPVTVEIQDDKPVFCKVDWGCDGDSKNGVGLIDEDKLEPNGNNDWWWGDDKGGKHADGEIIFNFGADKPGHLEVSNLEVKDSAGNILLNLALVIDPNDGSIDVSGLNNLKTANGEAITLVATLDEGTGLLTIVGQDADGNPAFTFTLQTTGGDIGEFDFCLNQALYHPFTDLNLQNDGPLTAFEDNLKFDFTVVGKDVDGDSATGHIKVNVDDDSPKAECDVDCVTEGKTDGALNFATGNVVTGDGDTIFGNDANGADGNADSPGADQPYTISKISHDGVQYLLHTPEVGDPFVTKIVSPSVVEEPLNNTTETFDPLTGILHIPTEEGGTLDIVLISDTPGNVGDYKYTVPENAQHEHTIHAGPVDLAQSVSGAFDDAGDWVASFASKGITLQPINGSHTLDVKNIDVAGGGSPDYRGIGVENFQGDEVEVDRGGNEGLRLNLASDVNNIALTIGALFDGTQYDNGHQEILEWKIYDNGNLVGSGQILGNNDGVVTLDIDSPFSFDRIELKPIDNGQGSSGNNSDFLLINAEICCPTKDFTEKFDYTLRDADGDESTATLKVDVKDTEPTREHGQDFITAFVVDEDGLPNGVGNTDSPFDNEENHNAPNAPADDAKHIGVIPFTPGADLVSIELSVLGGPDTGLKTLDNKEIHAAWDAATQTLVGYIEGTDPNDAPNQIFKMHITDAQTGAYEFELLQAVKHDHIGDSENLFNTPANFVVVAQIEDKDCDVLYSKVIVTIDDDMPVITECHDEQGNDINLLVNGSFEDLGSEDGGALDRGSWGVLSQIPGWKSGNVTDPNAAGVEIQADGAVPQIDAKDGEYYAELDSDTLNPGSPAPASTNASIYQDVETVDGNNYVLSFSYSPRVGDASTDGIEVWFDGVKVATIDSGKVGEWKEYTFVVEAGADALDSTPDSSRLEFKAVGTANKLGGFIDDVSLTACAMVDEDALPNGIEGGPGDDVGGACFSGSLGINFGADGGKSIAFFGEDYLQPELKSGGQEVNYEWVGAPGGLGTLIAYVGGNPWDASKQVFKVEVQSLDNGGEYKFTLLKPLDHPDSDNNPGNNNSDYGKGSFEDNLVFELKFKATDNDDDTVTGHLKINVDDDSPMVATTQGSFSLAVDETSGGAIGVDAPGGGTTHENDEADFAMPAAFAGYGTTIGEAQNSAAGLFTSGFGADGPGSKAYSLVVTGGGATGLIDTATNSAITLTQLPSGVVEGRSAVGNHLVFAFHIDGNGLVSMAQYRAVNHGGTEPAPGEHDEVISMLPGVLGVTLKVTDYDGDAVSATKDISGAISIDDDGPRFVDVCFDHGSNGTVDEDGLGFFGPGNHDLDNPAPGDDNFNLFGGVSTSGQINFAIGNDKPGVLSFGDLTITDSKGLVIPLASLKTADGNGVSIVQGAPDGNGVVTLKGIEAGSGDAVFTMTLDTSGGNMGDFKFTLNQALSHPYTDSDLNNDDNPETRYEDNLNFSFNVIAKDGDNDSAQGAINIVVDDDSPKALNDFDIVTEGKTDGNLNVATGNVVIGGDAPLLGKDSNSFLLDGTPDLPGADRPYTISKLTHDGVTYELSVNGLTVHNLQPGDTYNSVTGVLTIGTKEGGTFEIVMKSNVQSEVGEYRYTVPADADHAHDKHFGPESLAETRSDAFDTAQKWVDAFQLDGITLTNIGGTGFAIKNIDVNPKAGFGGAEDYRGIGISGGIDGGEVDTHQETMQLQFATPTDNAEVLIGAFFDGTQFDNGFLEIIQWKALAADGVTVIASGQILGSDNGLVTLDIDTNGVDFSYVQLTPLNNGAGGNSGNNSDFLLVGVETCCPNDKFLEQFDYTLRDSDGDESTATLTIDVKDTKPTIPDNGSGPLCLRVDEDGLPSGIGNGDSPNDDPFTNSAWTAGFIPFAPGADPVKIELSVGNGGDTGLQTLAGQAVLAAWDAESSTLIGYIAGTDPSDAANRVFTLTVTDHQTGAVTFFLVQPIKHADGGQDDNTENLPDPYFTVNVQIEDKDCDVAYTTVTVKIDDDMPVIGQGSGTIALAVDESLDGNGIPNNAPDVDPDPGFRQEDDEDGAGLPGVLTGLGAVIGASKSGAAGLFSFNPGADGLQSAVYSLTIGGGGAGPVATNLVDTQDGTLISLYTNPDGTVRGISAGGHLVFAFSINAVTGEVSMAQYRAINHGAEEAAPGNHDEEKSLGAPSSPTAPALTDLLSVTLTVTDKDNDTVSKTVDITNNVTFDDDGPSACIDKKHDNEVIHDESSGLQNDDRPNGSLPGVFSNVGLIGWAHSAAPVVTTFGSDYGTDGAGTTVLSLKVSGAGVDSGLDDTATGGNILLFQNGSIVEGRVQGTNELVFAVSINQDGTVDVAQYRAIEHPNPNDHDEDVGISNSALQAWVTVTDKDGDVATAHVDMGSRVRFDDDGPVACLEKVEGAKIVLDESVGLATGPYADGNAFDEDGNVAGDIGYAKVAGNLLFVDKSSYGTDGAGTTTYSLALSSNGTDSGLDDVLTGANVILVQVNATTIEGRASVAGPDPVVFRITINPSDGEVTISQFRAVEHDNPGDSEATHDESGSPEIMDQGKLFIRQTVTDGDLDKDTFDLDLGKLIKFEDDGPVAVNDVDSVEEDGTTIAIGNVYNGNNATSFGSDANGTDGNADDIGSDGFKQLQWKDPGAPGGFDGNGNVVGLYGTLFVDSDGDYKYVLNNGLKAVQDLNDGDKLYDIFKYVITDKDGDTSTAELKITICGEDDNLPPEILIQGGVVVSDEGLAFGIIDTDPAPDDETNDASAVGDFSVSDPNGDPLTVELLTDGLPDLKFGGETVVWSVSGGGVTLHGKTGGTDAITVQLSTDGAGLNYSYQVTLHKPLDHPLTDDPDTVATETSFEDEVSFDVTVKVSDGKGGSTTGQFSIEIEDDSPEPALYQTGGYLIVDESVGLSFVDPLSNDEEASVDPDDIGYFKSTIGSLFIGVENAGADQPAADKGFSLQVNPGDSLLFDTETNQQVVFSVNGITGVVEGHVGSDLVVTVSINPVDGVVEVHQYRAVKHGNPFDPDEDAGGVTIAGGIIDVVLTVTDSDGDAATTNLDLGSRIQFQDDGPRAVDDNVAATAGSAGSADVVFIVDVSGSMTNGGGSIVVPGVPDFSDDRLGLARYSMRELLTNHPEILNVQFIKFDDNLSSPSSVWMTRADALTYINNDANFIGGGATNYDVALQEAMNVYGASPRPAGEAAQTIMYFLSDGQPNTANDPGGDAGITNNGTGNDVSIAEWEGFVGNPANNITNVFAIGLGTAVVSQLEPIAYPNDDVDPNNGDEDRVIVIPDSNITALTQTLDDLLGSVVTPVTGDVTDNDDFGSDGAGTSKLVSVHYDGADYVFGPATQHIIDLGAGKGTLKIEDDGDYTYTPPSADTADGTPFYVEYVIRDGDGDKSTGKLNIDLAVPPTTSNVLAAGDEDTTIVVNLAGSDTDGTVAEFKITKLPTNGTLYADAGKTNEITLNETVTAIANAAQVFFVPTANFNGPVTFEYAAIDNEGLEDASPATASITVNSVNDPTIAGANHIYVGTDSSVTIEAAWLLLDDSDVDNALSVTSVDETSSKFAINDGGLPNTFTVNFDNGEPSGSADNFSYTLNTGTVVNGGQVHLDDNDANISGGATNDIVVGTGSNETLNGNGGNDVVIGGGGNDTLDGGNDAVADTLNGGDGNDTLIYRGAVDTYIGGTGSTDVGSASGDILDISLETSTVDLTAIANGQFSGIETIRMTGNGSDTLKLSSQDVIDLGSGVFNPVDGGVLPDKDAIRVDGDAGDTLQLSAGAGQWVEVTGSVSNEPGGYKVYAFDTNVAPGAQAATVQSYVIVDSDITVQIVA